MPRLPQIILLLFLLPFFAMAQRMGGAKTFVNIDAHADAGMVYYSLCQDSTGMIWLGTNMGLFDYDGYSMHRRFADVPGCNTNINCLMVVDDVLYAGADAGVLFFDISADEHIPHEIAFPTDVRSFALDEDSVLWVGSLKGLYKYDISGGSLQNMSDGLPHNAVYAVRSTSSGDIYVGTYNGLCRFDSETGRFSVIHISEPRQGGNLFVNSLADDPGRGCLWVGTEGALYKYSYDDGVSQAVGQFNGQYIKSLAIAANGDLVVGTDNGLFVYSELRMESYRHDSRISTSLSNNVVWSVMADRDGNLWAGTESGLSVWVNGGSFSAFPLYRLTGSSDGGRFYSIFRDSRGYLWLGGTNGLIRRSPRGKVNWYKMENDRYPLRHNRVRSISEDGKYELWVATDGGINRFDYVKEQFVNYLVTDSTLAYNANWAYGIVEDKQGRLWIGSYLGGLLAVDCDKLVGTGGGKCVADIGYNSTNGLPNNMITQLVKSENGSIWASLYKSGKIVKVVEEGGGVKVIDVSNGYIQYIAADRRSNSVWCGYHNGFALVSEGDTVAERHSFPSSSGLDVYAMEVTKNNLWISTSGGVWVLNFKSGKMQHLRLPDKLYTSIYYDRAFRKMLLGGDEELLVVDPSILSSKGKKRDIKITALRINDESYEPEVPANVGEIDKLQLSHGQNRVEVEFSDFDYQLDNRKDFEYRVTGISDEWVSLPPGDNSILIAGMSPGNYMLEIRPVEGLEDVVCRLAIKIRPAWYASWWAITIYVLLGVLFLLWIFNFLRLKIRLRLERVRSEKTLEMVNSRMEFLTNISHELKTPLSMIIGPLSKMLNDEKNPETRRHLDAIQQNALKLNTLIHRALEVNRMDDNPDNLLIYSQIEMVSFCRSIFETYREGFPTKQFVFSCDEKRLLVNADAVKMESVINNVLSNACKYTGDNATIAMSLSLSGSDVVITVSDDGVGIPADELPFIFQRLYQSSATVGHKEGTGIGLYLAKTYVEMHHGSIRAESVQGEGSVFTITIPAGEVAEPVSEAAEPGKDRPADDASGKPKVLVVEDNASIAAFICEILKDDYTCITADNGRAGLTVCNSVCPDLIIADMMMPVMDGLEMCRRIKHNGRLAAVPIILLTAKDDRLTEGESIRAGVDAFMSKPFEAGMLLDRVKQLLGAREIMRRNLRVEEITTVRQPQAAESADEKMLASVAKVIEDNISDPDMNVGYVCEKSGLSSKQLYRLLKSYVGVSPSDYIRQIRMKKAAMLLARNKFNVSEVMYMVGFSSSSYFSKCFAAQFGCTPREYVERKTDIDGAKRT